MPNGQLLYTDNVKTKFVERNEPRDNMSVRLVFKSTSPTHTCYNPTMAYLTIASYPNKGLFHPNTDNVSFAKLSFSWYFPDTPCFIKIYR